MPDNYQQTGEMAASLERLRKLSDERQADLQQQHHTAGQPDEAEHRRAETADRRDATADRRDEKQQRRETRLNDRQTALDERERLLEERGG